MNAYTVQFFDIMFSWYKWRRRVNCELNTEDGSIFRLENSTGRLLMLTLSESKQRIGLANLPTECYVEGS